MTPLKYRPVLLMLAAVLPWIVAGRGVPAAAAPLKILFDTDMDTDCDDGGTMAMLHALADAGEIEILATMVSSYFPYSVPCVAAINRYYGRPDLPIGCPQGDGRQRGSRYARQIAEQFPTRFKTNRDAPEAALLYRKILAAQPDASVTIVTVGDLTNLRFLLETKADEHSPRDGAGLVRQKVNRWVCMGGRYPEHLDPAVYGNFKPDAESTVKAIRDWPTTIFFSGLGEDIQTGRGLRDLPADNPVRRIYELYLGDRPTRSSWDQVTLLYAARSEAPFWKLTTQGSNHIFPNGTNQWRPTPDLDHVLIDFAPGVESQVQQTIEQLMVQPPRHRTP